MKKIPYLLILFCLFGCATMPQPTPTHPIPTTPAANPHSGNTLTIEELQAVVNNQEGTLTIEELMDLPSARTKANDDISALLTDAENQANQVLGKANTGYHHLPDDRQGHMANLRLDAMKAPQATGFIWGPGKSHLNQDQIMILDSIFQNGQVIIHQVESRTDRSGNNELNRRLAQERAGAIIEHLKKRGAQFAPDFQKIERPANNNPDGYVVYSSL